MRPSRAEPVAAVLGRRVVSSAFRASVELACFEFAWLSSNQVGEPLPTTD